MSWDIQIEHISELLVGPNMNTARYPTVYSSSSWHSMIKYLLHYLIWSNTFSIIWSNQIHSPLSVQNIPHRCLWTLFRPFLGSNATLFLSAKQCRSMEKHFVNFCLRWQILQNYTHSIFKLNKNHQESDVFSEVFAFVKHCMIGMTATTFPVYILQEFFFYLIYSVFFFFLLSFSIYVFIYTSGQNF